MKPARNSSKRNRSQGDKMGIESKYIWMDGEMLPYEQANVQILYHTLHYGLGAFEGS